MGIVDETHKKDKFRKKLWGQWERVKVVVLSWIMNTISSNLLSGIVYMSTTWSIWKELKERFDKINGSRTFNQHTK